MPMERVDRFETIVEGLEAGKVLPFEKLREFFNPGGSFINFGIL